MALSSNNLNLIEQLQEKEKEIGNNPEKVLAKGALQPFNNSSSGARKLLFSTQKNHIIPIIEVYYEILKKSGYNPEVFFDPKFTIDTGMICNMCRDVCNK